MDLDPKSYVSAAVSDTAFVMAIQTHTGVIVCIAASASKSTLTRCYRFFFFFKYPSPQWQASISSLLTPPAVSVNHVSRHD